MNIIDNNYNFKTTTKTNKSIQIYYFDLLNRRQNIVKFIMDLFSDIIEKIQLQ